MDNHSFLVLLQERNLFAEKCRQYNLQLEAALLDLHNAKQLIQKLTEQLQQSERQSVSFMRKNEQLSEQLVVQVKDLKKLRECRVQLDQRLEQLHLLNLSQQKEILILGKSNQQLNFDVRVLKDHVCALQNSLTAAHADLHRSKAKLKQSLDSVDQLSLSKSQAERKEKVLGERVEQLHRSRQSFKNRYLQSREQVFSLRSGLESISTVLR